MRTLRLTWFCLLVDCACMNLSRPIPRGSSDPDAVGGAGAAADSDAPPAADGGMHAATTPNAEVTRMHVTVGSAVFAATLFDNATTRAFAAMLPLTLNMIDVNANEKYYEFADRLPANATGPRSIHAGDVMLYGSSGLVLFYKTFSTSYSYTQIGKIDNASGLAAALGAGNATVTFSL